MSQIAPLTSIVLDAPHDSPRGLRDIECRYQLELIAQDDGALRQFYRQALRHQATRAARNVRDFVEATQRQGEPEEARESLIRHIDTMARGIQHLPDAPPQPHVRPEEDPLLNDAVYGLEAAVLECFDRLTDQIRQEQETLLLIAERLRRPYETEAQELRTEATKWLLQGMTHTGRERADDLDDAMRLLRDCVDNPIGRQDYVAWFEIGWMLWKRDGDLAEAEEAFYHAQRLSGPAGDLYHLKALRHYAYMQSLQEKHDQAYQTMQRARAVSRDHDTGLDAARCAARAGCGEEALALLEDCIADRPTTLVTMFAETDFRPLFPKMAALAERRLTQAHDAVRAGLQGWHTMVGAVREAERRADTRILLSLPLLVWVTEATRQCDAADFLKAVGVARQASWAVSAGWSQAQTQLIAEIEGRKQAVTDARQRWEQSKRRLPDRLEEMEQRRREASARLEEERVRACSLAQWPLLGALQRQSVDAEFRQRQGAVGAALTQQAALVKAQGQAEMDAAHIALREAEARVQRATDAQKFLQSAHMSSTHAYSSS